MPHPHNRELIERSIDAWKTRDPGYIAEVFHEELIYEDVPLSKVMKGLVEFREFFDVNTFAFPDIEMKLIAVTTDSIYGAAEWTLSGTFLGKTVELGSPSGKRFDIRGASFFRFRDNRILTATDYFDGPSFTSQLAQS